MSQTQISIVQNQVDDSKLQDLVSHISEILWKDQREDGHWHYAIDDNITMNAEYIMFLAWMKENEPELVQRLANFIVRSQLADGSWNLYEGGSGDLSTTIECYFALRLAGYKQDSDELTRARGFIHEHGGLQKARVFTRIWLCLFNLMSWKAVPIVPPEIMLAPKGSPFHILEFSYWSRTVIIPLTILFHEKKMTEVDFDLDELYLHPKDKTNFEFPIPRAVDDSWYLRRPLLDWKWLRWDQIFVSLTQAANLYEKRMPVKPLRKAALEKARQWILDHQDEEGDWGGIVPAMMNAVMALHAEGMSKNEPAIAKGMDALKRLTRGLSADIRPHAHEDASTATLQSCVSPVWDTALATLGLLEAGVDPKDDRIQKAKDWLWSQRITQKSDWLYKSTLPMGEKTYAWCFQYFNKFFPDLDDSTLTTLVLYKAGMTKEQLKPALNWIYCMQNKDGGWGTFDRENCQWILNEIPFADLKALIDPSNADLTGHILETLGAMGESNTKAVRRAIRYLERTQRDNGSWFGRWGVHTIYGTSAAVVGMRKVGVPIENPMIQRALYFIEKSQNADGGWGENGDNYRPDCETGVGNSTPSQTAWALLVLQACRGGDKNYEAMIQRGLDFLNSRKTVDGFEEKEFTGTGFPLHFYLRYDGYRKFFPAIALGRLQHSS